MSSLRLHLLKHTSVADPVQVGCDNSECGFWIHADCDNISPERLKVCRFSCPPGLHSRVSKGTPSTCADEGSAMRDFAKRYECKGWLRQLI
jgi:hypothetical protein